MTGGAVPQTHGRVLYTSSLRRIPDSEIWSQQRAVMAYPGPI